MQKVHCLKVTSYVFLAIPTSFLLLFAFGEGISGIQHFLQAIPLLLTFALGWKYPKISGILLIIVSLLLGSMYWVTMSLMFPVKLLIESILFLPALCGGILLILSSSRKFIR